ncbi:spore coat protein U domain-containing protein [Pseudoxanthomonas sp. NC8]|nr:spore coat protein U domain-containing protein [Pseudoxanthomonas sp. NC8]
MASCFIDSQGAIAFGTVHGGGATTTGTISIVCDNGAAGARTFRICLYVNPNNPPGIDPRKMVNYNPSAYMDYDIFADPAMTRTVGSTTSGHAVYSTAVTAPSTGQIRGLSAPLPARAAAEPARGILRVPEQPDPALSVAGRDDASAGYGLQHAFCGTQQLPCRLRDLRRYLLCQHRH